MARKKSQRCLATRVRSALEGIPGLRLCPSKAVVGCSGQPSIKILPTESGALRIAVRDPSNGGARDIYVHAKIERPESVIRSALVGLPVAT